MSISHHCNQYLCHNFFSLVILASENESKKLVLFKETLEKKLWFLIAK